MSEDADLLARAGAGDDGAFEALYARWAPKVHRHLHLLLGRGHGSWAEDCLQETFLRVRRSAARYDGRHAFSTWLFAIAHHEAMRLHRREALRRTLPLSPALSRTAPGPAGEGRGEALPSALAALPEEVRSALLLVHIQGLGRRETAEVMGLSGRRVQDLCHQGFVQLRKILEKA